MEGAERVGSNGVVEYWSDGGDAQKSGCSRTFQVSVYLNTRSKDGKGKGGIQESEYRSQESEFRIPELVAGGQRQCELRTRDPKP